MKWIISFWLFLYSAHFCLSQSDTLCLKSNTIQIGTGTIGYMNSYYLPGGLLGYNYSCLYTHKTLKKKKKKIESINYLIAYFSYSNLSNPKGEPSINKPTNFYNFNLNYQKYYKYLPYENLQAYLGFNFGFSSSSCQTPYYISKSLYHMPVFGYCNLSTGVNNLIRFKTKNFIIENRTVMPLLLYGYFYEFQNYPTEFVWTDMLKLIDFAHFLNYTEIENSISVYYTGLHFKKLKLPIFITYSFINHKSDINYNVQKFRKNTIYLGFLIK